MPMFPLVTETETKTFRGRTLDALLPEIREELGPDAIVLRRREGLAGGVGGFFQRSFVEVEARRALPGELEPPSPQRSRHRRGPARARDPGARRAGRAVRRRARARGQPGRRPRVGRAARRCPRQRARDRAGRPLRPAAERAREAPAVATLEDDLAEVVARPRAALRRRDRAAGPSRARRSCRAPPEVLVAPPAAPGRPRRGRRRRAAARRRRPERRPGRRRRRRGRHPRPAVRAAARASRSSSAPRSPAACR